MRQPRALRYLAILAIPGFVAFAAEPNHPSVATDSDVLADLACEAGQAYARRDLEALDRLSADDYVQTDVRGGVLNRAEWRDFVRIRKSDLTVECDSIAVRFYGGAAVVTGGWTYTRKTPAEDVVTRSRWTSVWTKSSGGWKRHLFQNTYVNPNADHCGEIPKQQ